ncbi:hexosaminidase [Deinobacterium chartae]|uniref:beta-N-acetylhexosaminidase n=1 Tax=Deinobacterium chartae TaxID=521158 RepID=A0A841HXB5_9DEIO|nr:beta-N-acetylhexosaminidase [Deinobacterium chartae]MBB6097493.1 hexosaminidase [Deinobacterium chartae]
MPVLPRPLHSEVRPGILPLSRAAVLLAPDVPAARALKTLLQSAPQQAPHTCELRLVEDPAHGEEGYGLEVHEDGLRLEAATPAGLFWGVQTLRQLAGTHYRLPCLTVRDRPAFGWRGLHLDCARHFMPKEFVLKLLDLMALHKLNRFHWHLTDDQGWRLEVRRYPRLTEVGAWRSETLVGHGLQLPYRYDGVPHGGFYTQQDVREIVTRARELCIEVIPEIEMPGHAQAALAAHPELGHGEPPTVWTRWGVSTRVMNLAEPTFAFLEGVLDEVLELFPGRWVHLGGDEVLRDEWAASEVAQARMREWGTDLEGLQGHFMRRMAAYLERRGRRMAGWDEILDGNEAPAGALVMAWRGEANGVRAARLGHPVVMAPYYTLYFDHYQRPPQQGEPLAIGGLSTLEALHAYRVIPQDLEEEHRPRVLGAQAQLWTEYVPTPRHAEYMLFPRLCAFAEAVWSDAARGPLEDFRARLEGHMDLLAALDVNAHPLAWEAEAADD